MRIQIDRQAFAEAKLIFGIADDQIEVNELGDDDEDEAADVTIFDKDDSVVYLDYAGYENYAHQRRDEEGDAVRRRASLDALSPSARLLAAPTP